MAIGLDPSMYSPEAPPIDDDQAIDEISRDLISLGVDDHQRLQILEALMSPRETHSVQTPQGTYTIRKGLNGRFYLDKVETA